MANTNHFSFVGPGDEISDMANAVGSHEVLNPLCKELIQLCDVAGKDKTAKTARDLESLIIALKEEIASQQSAVTSYWPGSVLHGFQGFY
ncbi:hypothetical protein IV203_029480 [Nitzschia inconspicua]|uniref:Uncharacterized protein n=1 Tax=Nitzschia inconspicua TaxID=303405 RepID=A0A9K3LRP3_9STRA|nr:hypothetical protein IV203_029480 [Nitzschia inconspicua]